MIVNVQPPNAIAIPTITEDGVIQISILPPTTTELIVVENGSFSFTGIGAVQSGVNMFNVVTVAGVAQVSYLTPVTVVPEALRVLGDFRVDQSSELVGDVSVVSPAVLSADVGGDLSGSLPNPTVQKIQGRSVVNTAPANQDILQWDTADNRWEPHTLASSGLALSAHTHTSINDLTMFQTGTPTDNDLWQWDTGSGTWKHETLAVAGISAVGHTHTLSEITDYNPYDPTKAVIFFDDFLNQNNEAGEVGNGGWNFSLVTLPQMAAEVNHPGIVRIRCSGTANQVGYLTTALTNAGSTNQFSIDNLNEFIIIFRDVQTDIDCYRTYGMNALATSAVGVPAGIYLRKDTFGAWYFVTRTSAGAETATSLGSADANWHKMRVTYTSSSVSMYWDGSGSASATHTTNIPTADIVAPFIILTPTGTSLIRTTDIDFVSYKLNAISR